MSSDGTVPLLSLGYMSAPSGAWTKYADLYNPGRSPIIAREYLHEASDSALDVRGGPKASDHVNLLGMCKINIIDRTTKYYDKPLIAFATLGNWEMITDLLRIVSNKPENVTQRIISNIEEYADAVDLTANV
jgi:phospholipid:diacylglycerol acyltransferase